MNLTTLRSNFNQKVFGDSTSTAVSNTIIDGYLNEAYQDFLIIVMPFYRWTVNGEIATTSIVADQDEYILPSNLIRVVKVFITEDGEDTELEEDQWEIFDKSLFLKDETLYDTAITDGLKLKYQDEFTALSGTTDSPNIPTAFHPFLYKKASQNYCEDKEMWNKYNSLGNWIEKEQAKIEDHYYNKTKKSVLLEPKEENYY